MRHLHHRLAWLLALLAALSLAPPAAAHPVPFSYVNLNLHEDGIDGTVAIHVSDAAHELSLAEPRSLLDPNVLAAQGPALRSILQPRLGISAAPVRWTGQTAVAGEDALTLSFRIEGHPPGALVLHPSLFSYDPFHEIFVAVYEDGKLSQQFAFSAGTPPQTYFRGTSSGLLAVMRAFVPAGVHHIWIGADHLLFLLGLIIAGGGWRRLALVVTAFTIGHSITLALAALEIVTLPARLVESAIALTIVLVGLDNLLRRQAEGPDLRVPAAAAFGLIHGFGFASGLTDLGLSKQALGWSLFSFNVGVEVGQLAVVILVASLLEVIRRHRAAAIGSIQALGSALVVAAGAYWFVQRAFF